MGRGLVYALWNPVKELKDLRMPFVDFYCTFQVESGEGIERLHTDHWHMLHRKVESGEGIERARSAITSSRRSAKSSWNPVKELKVLFLLESRELQNDVVESGEGIERWGKMTALSFRDKLWNPVKELKVTQSWSYGSEDNSIRGIR